jgi:predicted nuclease of restriction endonuclease-like (RecB) superfamily
MTNLVATSKIILEFLDLKDEYSESDLEAALIQNFTDFLLELGDDFAFGRQRRLRIDDTWFRIDLVFFHRRSHLKFERRQLKTQNVE